MKKSQDINYWANRPTIDHGDWLDGKGDWIKAYWQSKSHPHRQLIINHLKLIKPIESVLEIGMNCGPNLSLIKDYFNLPENKLFGIDANKDAIDFGREQLPKADLRIGDFSKLPWLDRVADVVLADASLMYVAPGDIRAVIQELDRVSKRVIFIVDRYHRTKNGVNNGYVWRRNYKLLLNDFGYNVLQTKISVEDWPVSIGWQKYGYIWLGKKV